MLKPLSQVLSMCIKRYGLLLFFSLLFNFSFAQTKISGRITNVNNDSVLNAVSIQVKGRSAGTVSDESGAFSITLKLPATLVFTALGYVPKEVNIIKEQDLVIRMETSDQNLDQVVVVAYGTQKKTTVTGAIASIGTKELKQSPAANLQASLTGRLPGLTAIQTSSEPGKDPVALYLRGQGSVNGQSPVILVDGVPRDISYIDPNEVESVTILKDASSTAVFGVRGANGVILVTTRRGKTDKPEINLTAEGGLQSFTRRPEFISSYDWATVRNEISANDGGGQTFSQDQLNHFKNGDDPTEYPDNNWVKTLTKKYVAQQRYNLNLSGGSEYVRYFINAGFLNQGGQWKISQNDYDPSSYLKRYNFRSNIDAFLTKNKSLRAFLNLGGYLENVNSPAGTNGGLGLGNSINQLLTIYATPPITPGPFTPDGKNLVVYKNNPSPYGEINNSGYVQQTRSNILASFGMEQDLKFITPGLSAKFQMSFDTRTLYYLTESQNYAKYNLVNLTGANGQDSIGYIPANNDQNTTLSPSVGQSFQTYTNFQLYLNYNRTFGRHAVSGLILAQKDKTIKPQGADNPDQRDFPLPFNLRGLSARITYAYNNKYLAEFNAGYNGSEQFAPSNRYGFFPAVSAGWVLSREAFLNNSKIISLLKLRGSYGVVGNDKITSGTRFLYLDNTIIQGGGYAGSNGTLGVLGQTINESYVGNPNLQWETSKKADIGLELGLMNQLNLIVDVYQSNTDKMLIGRGTVPILNGLPQGALPKQNLGKLKNQGYEIELNYSKSITKNLSVLAKLNFNYAHNKIEFIDEAEKTADYAYRYWTTGFSVGQNFGLLSDGFYNSQDEIDHSGLTFLGRAPRPGDLKFKDLNGDGIIDTKDFAPIGHTNVPQYTYGATFGINYKDLDVSVLFQGVSHVSQDYRGWGVWENYGNGYFTDRHMNAWTAERAANGSSIEFPALSASQSSSETYPTDYWMENTAYIRLKNVEVGYTFPIRWSGKISAKRIRVYANGFNLITWDHMKNKGFDPEVLNSSFNSGPLAYPIYKIYNIGVNLVF